MGITDRIRTLAEKDGISLTDDMPLALKKLVVGHSENMDTEGIYGHQKSGDLDRAASYIDCAFDKVFQEEE